jgi:PAS domain S-box-containing protein
VNITEHKRAQEALQREKAYTEGVINSVPDMLLTFNQEGRLSYANEAMAQFAGVKAKAIVGKTLRQLVNGGIGITPESASIVMERLRKRLKTGEPITDVEVEMRNSRGEIVPCAYSASEIRGPDGEVMGEVVIARDISERKRAEAEIRKRNREMAAIHDVLISITQTFDIDEIMMEIVSQVGMAVGSEYTSIVLLNQDDSIRLGGEDFVDIPPLPTQARPDGVTRRIIASGKSEVINDVDAVEDTNPVLVTGGIKSYAGVPIKTTDAVIGVMFVHSRQRNAFADSLNLLAGFGTQAAIAIENARLYQEASTVGALVRQTTSRRSF